jgi:hypothetical protein
MQSRYIPVFAAVIALAAGSPALGWQAPARTQKPAEPPSSARNEAAAGQPVNIKLEVAITDQTGSGDPLKKVVTLVVADRGSGSIRSLGTVRTQGRVQINMDARPYILQSGAIRVTIGLEYNPRVLGNDAPTEWSSLNEQLAVVLDPGKPLVVSQAADPASDRRITVQVTATLLKQGPRELPTSQLHNFQLHTPPIPTRAAEPTLVVCRNVDHLVVGSCELRRSAVGKL